MCAVRGTGWRVYPPRGSSAHTGRILGWHKNGEYVAVTRGRPAFQRHEAHAEDSDTTPHAEMPKMQNGSLIISPNRAPAETQRSGFGGKRTSDRERESCSLRRDEGFVVRSDDGQHRICLVCGEAAALPNALGGAWPHTPKLRAEAHTHSKLRAFLRKRFYPPPAAQLQRGTSPPLRNPQLSEGARETISERSSIMKKISNSARAWRPPTARRSGHWRRRPTCP